MIYDKLDDDSQESFLTEDKDSNSDSSFHERKPKSSLRLIVTVAVLSIIIHFALSWWRVSAYYSSCHTLPDTSRIAKLYNPFQGVLETQIETWEPDAWDNSVFVGPPSKKLDDAWDKLQRVQGIRVYPDEAPQLDLDSKIRLKNGDQAAIMGYFHNLHCIRYLYQGLHPETYPRGGDANHAKGHHHDYHCIEVLRRSVLCQPDLSVHAIRWQDEKKLGMDLFPESKRECVNFQALFNYSLTRTFPRNSIVGVEDSVVPS